MTIWRMRIACAILSPLHAVHLSCRENQNTYFMSYNLFFQNRTVYDIMLKHILVPDRAQKTI
jgi:hypothetical protein